MFRYKRAVVHFSNFTAEGYTNWRFQRYRKEKEEEEEEDIKVPCVEALYGLLCDDVNVKHLRQELNPSAQRCLPRFFTGDFNFLRAHCATSLYVVRR
jgi:hypothetical protein